MQTGSTHPAFSAAVTPPDATVTTVSWSSLDEGTIIVNPGTGAVISTPGKGATYIVATVNDYGTIFRDSVAVEVIALSGEGSATTPFTIGSRADLEELSYFANAAHAGLHFRLTADVDLGSANWTPIAGVFGGKLHGGNHQLRNISISAGANGAGLFAELGSDARIDSLHIVGGSISGTGAGSIAAQATTGSGAIEIIACSNSATIIGVGAGTSSAKQGAGGIIGDVNVSGGTLIINACANLGDVTTTTLGVGGIVGGHSGIGNGTLSITSCYNNAEITSTNAGESYVGGIGGYLYQSSATGAYTFQNSYATGSATGKYAAGLLGRVPNTANTSVSNNIALQNSLAGDDSHAHPVLGYNAGSHTSADNYSLENIPGANSGGNAGQNGQNTLTLADAKTASWYAANLPAWDFTNVWAIRDGESFPYFQYQSAPIAVKSIDVGIITLDALAAGNVNIYKGTAKTFVATENVAAGDNNITVSGLTFGDTLYVVTNEAGKAPSYAVKTVLDMPTHTTTYTVTFAVADTAGTAITDAVVTFDEVAYPSGSYAFTDLANGSYTYSVAKSGYVTATNSVTVSDADVTVNVTLQLLPPPPPPVYTVSFLLKDSKGVAITGATITFNGVTNAAGNYTFTGVPDGNYAYTITKSGYETKTDNLTVSGADVDLTVTLTASTGIFGNESSLTVMLYPNPVKAGQAIRTLLPDGAGGSATVRIYDLNGTLISEQLAVNASVTAPANAGMYFLLLELPNGQTAVQRIVVK
jgi:hypothetical protein